MDNGAVAFRSKIGRLTVVAGIVLVGGDIFLICLFICIHKLFIMGLNILVCNSFALYEVIPDMGDH